jgi:hypothetical protein
VQSFDDLLNINKVVMDTSFLDKSYLVIGYQMA